MKLTFLEQIKIFLLQHFRKLYLILAKRPLKFNEFDKINLHCIIINNKTICHENFIKMKSLDENSHIKDQFAEVIKAQKLNVKK